MCVVCVGWRVTRDYEWISKQVRFVARIFTNYNSLSIARKRLAVVRSKQFTQKSFNWLQDDTTPRSIQITAAPVRGFIRTVQEEGENRISYTGVWQKEKRGISYCLPPSLSQVLGFLSSVLALLRETILWLCLVMSAKTTLYKQKMKWASFACCGGLLCTLARRRSFSSLLHLRFDPGLL